MVQHPDTGGVGEQRPSPSQVATGAQLRRWYWLRTELVEVARRLGISAAGSKEDLTDRVAAVLDGQPPPAPTGARRSVARQLEGPLTLDTVIPIGQRCSQPLRVFFTAHIGAGFVFDAAMRSFIADRAGATLGDAVEHWHATRTTQPREIDTPFELNRFTRQWHIDHPDGTRTELRQAWTAYRNTPTDQRDRA